MKTINKPTMYISLEELQTILMNVERPTFTKIVSKTKPNMNKTDNPYFDQIEKTSIGKYFIGGTFEDMVNNRMIKEGLEPNFTSEECSVGQKVEGSKCLQFNDRLNRYYLQYFIFPTSNIKSEYTFQNNPIEMVMFQNFLVKKSNKSRQPQENKHRPQSFMLSNIKEITLNGVHYVID